MDSTEPERKGLNLQSRKRKSFNRRSSILKSPSRNALLDVDANPQADGETTTRMSKSRRVSFADTYQVKEFAKYSLHQLPIDSDKENIEGAVEHQCAVKITGLDKLLTGPLCNQAPIEDNNEVKELPFPKDQDSSSILSNVSLPETDSGPDKTDTSAFLKSLAKKLEKPSKFNDSQSEQIEPIEVKELPFPKDQDSSSILSTSLPETDSGPDKTDTSAFLKSLAKKLEKPSNGCIDTQDAHIPFQESDDVDNICGGNRTKELDFIASLKKLMPKPSHQESFDEVFVPAQQFPDNFNLGVYSVSSKPDFDTVINTQLNKFSPSPLSAWNKTKSKKITELSEKSGCTGDPIKALFSKSSNQASNCDPQVLPAVQTEQMLTKAPEEFPSKRLIPAEWFTKSTSGKFVPIEDKENRQNVCVLRPPISHGKITFGLSDQATTVQSTQKIDICQTSAFQQSKVSDEGIEMEMTVCHGNIKLNETEILINCQPEITLADTNTGIQITKSIYNVDSETILKPEEQSCDATRRFSPDECEAAMEMTACYGNIKSNETLSSNKLVEDGSKTFNQNDIETGLKMTCLTSQKISLGDQTKLFSSEDLGADLEITKCYSNIVSEKTPKHKEFDSNDFTRRFVGVESEAEMEMTICLGNIRVNTMVQEKKTLSEDRTQRCSNDDTAAEMEMTNCYGENNFDKTTETKANDFKKRFQTEDLEAGMEITKCYDKIDLSNTTQDNKINKDDFTRRFDSNDTQAGMEMTKCYDKIDLSNITQDNQINKEDFTRRFDSNDTQAGMEMTKCYDKIDLSNITQDNQINKEDFTRRFDSNDTQAGMEITKCYGKIDLSNTIQDNKISKDDFTKRFDSNDTQAGMEMTKCYGQGDLSNTTQDNKISKDDFTKRFDSNDTQAGMEMTKCYDKIDLSNTTQDNKINKDDFTKRFDSNDTQAGMEITKCYGQIDLSNATQDNKINKEDFTKRFDSNDTHAGMEMTKCYGQIGLSNTTQDNKITKDDFTKRFDCNDTQAGMEITKCYGQIDLSNTTQDNKITKDDFTKRFDSNDTQAGMEITKCYGQIDLSNTTQDNKITKDDFTKRFDSNDTQAGMEITKCYGQIDLSNTTQDNKINKDDFTRRFDSNDTQAGMEMTKCYGQIDLSNAPQDNKINKDDFTRRFESNDTQAGMEMTKCHGQIDLSNTIQDNKINKDDFTRRFDSNDTQAGMEMTKCYGDRDSEITFNLKKDAQTDQTHLYFGDETEAAMELTIGLNNDKADKILVSKNLKSSDATQKFSSDDTASNMEMTCFDGINVGHSGEGEITAQADFTKRFSSGDTGVEMDLTSCNDKLDEAAQTFSSETSENIAKGATYHTELYGLTQNVRDKTSAMLNTFSAESNKNTDFQALKPSACKRPLSQTHRRSINQSIYPPEKVARLLGQSRRSSNLVHLEEKIQQIKHGDGKLKPSPNQQVIMHVYDETSLPSKPPSVTALLQRLRSPADLKDLTVLSPTVSHSPENLQINDEEKSNLQPSSLNIVPDEGKTRIKSKERNILMKHTCSNNTSHFESQNQLLPISVTHKNGMETPEKHLLASSIHYSESDGKENNLGNPQNTGKTSTEGDGKHNKTSDESLIDTSQNGLPDFLQNSSFDEIPPEKSIFLPNSPIPNFQDEDCSGSSPNTFVPLATPDGTPLPTSLSILTINLPGDITLSKQNDVTLATNIPMDITLPTNMPINITLPPNIPEDLTFPTNTPNNITLPTNIQEDVTFPTSVREKTKLQTVGSMITVPTNIPKDITLLTNIQDITSPNNICVPGEITLPSNMSEDITLPTNIQSEGQMSPSVQSQWQLKVAKVKKTDSATNIESVQNQISADKTSKRLIESSDNMQSQANSPDSVTSISSQKSIEISPGTDGTPLPSLSILTINLPGDITLSKQKDITLATNIPMDITLPTNMPINITLPPNISEDLTFPTNTPNNITLPTNVQEDVTFPTSVREKIQLPTIGSMITVPTNIPKDITLLTNIQDITLSNNDQNDITSPTNICVPGDITLPTNISEDITLPTNIQEDFTMPTNRTDKVTLPPYTSNELSLAEEISFPTIVKESIPMSNSTATKTYERGNDGIEAKEKDKTIEMTKDLLASSGQLKGNLKQDNCSNMPDTALDNSSKYPPHCSQDNRANSAESFPNLSKNSEFLSEGQMLPSVQSQCQLPVANVKKTDSATNIESDQNHLSADKTESSDNMQSQANSPDSVSSISSQKCIEISPGNIQPQTDSSDSITSSSSQKCIEISHGNVQSQANSADGSMEQDYSVPPSSLCQKNMSTMDMTLSQSYIGSQCSISNRPENTSYFNLSVPAVWDFDQLSSIGQVPLDWSGVGRRSSFAPVQELNEEGILENVLIDSCQVEHIQIACAEMEERTKQLLQKMSELVSSIEDEKKAQYQEKAQHNREYLSTCRKRAKKHLKPCRLRWVRAESKALEVNKERIRSAVNEITDLSERVESEINNINEELKQTADEISRFENVPMPSESEILELNNVKEQVLQKTQDLKQTEGELKEAEREISIETEKRICLQVDLSKAHQQGNKVSADGQKSEEDAYFKYNSRRSLTEWSIVSGSEQSVRFLFLYGYIVLDVEFWQDPSRNTDFRQIDLVSLKSSLTSDTCKGTSLAHNLVVKELARDMFEQYEDETQLPELLRSVSELVGKAKSFEQQLNDLPFRHRSSVSGTSVSVEYLNLSKAWKCSVTFDLSCDQSPLTSADIHIHPIMGPIDEEAILRVAQEVSRNTCPQYLRSLVSAVDRLMKDGDTKSIWPISSIQN